MRIFLSPPHQSGSEALWLRRALESNYLAPVGPMLDELEAWFREYWHLSHALAVQSATAALHLAIHHLREYRHPPTDPRPPLVIASSFTFIASISPALHQGCEVWLVDSEAESWNMDPILLARALEEADRQSRQVLTVVPTELYGQACDLDAIHGLTSPRGIPILLDAAESLGAESTCTSTPWARVTSFNGNKIVTSSAGGMLVSDDALLIDHARKLSMQAREPVAHYEHRELGYNFRMSNLLAAVALSQLETLEERVTRRREIFDRYRNDLGEIDGISWMPEAVWNKGTRWLTTLRMHPETTGWTPEDLRIHLEQDDIESRPVWKPLHLQPVLHHLPTFLNGTSDQIFREGLCLPSGSGMTDEDVARVINRVRVALP